MAVTCDQIDIVRQLCFRFKSDTAMAHFGDRLRDIDNLTKDGDVACYS